MREFIQGYLIDVFENLAEPVNFCNELNAMYRLLKCDCVSMPVRYIDGREYTVICDESASKKMNTKVSSIDSHNNADLIGSLLVVGHYANGRVKGLTAEEVTHIDNNVGIIFMKDQNRAYNSYCLFNCEKEKKNKEE